MSPLLFNLFISDIDSFFRERGYEGVSIDDKTNIPILAYADDLTVISDSPVQLNKALTILEQYCATYDLTVNINKTKILTISKGKLPNKTPKFYYKNQLLEEVTSFNYLGVCFTRRGVFEEATKQAIARGRTAAGVIKQTLAAASNRSFDAACRVYSASLLGIMLYCSPVWSIRYTHQLEVAQNYFFKKYFSLKINSPHYIVRREFRMDHVTVKIVKQTLKYINKIHELEDGNLVKRCFNRLFSLDSVGSNRVKYNWVSQVKHLFDSMNVDHQGVFNSPFPNTFIKNAILALSTKLYHEDSEKIHNSSYSSLYPILNISLTGFSYLNSEPPLPYHVQRVLAQIRTSGKDSIKIIVSNTTHIIKSNENCLLCNSGQFESLGHIFLHCTHYQTERKAFLPMHLVSEESSDETNIASILATIDIKHAKNIYYFISNSLKRREFFLEE